MSSIYDVISDILKVGKSSDCMLYYNPADAEVVKRIKSILYDIDLIEESNCKVGTIYCFNKSVFDISNLNFDISNLNLESDYKKPEIYATFPMNRLFDCTFKNQVIWELKGDNKMTDAERIKKAVELTSYMLDTYTENTDEDKAYRNSARMFLHILTDEEIETED